MYKVLNYKEGKQDFVAEPLLDLPDEFASIPLPPLRFYSMGKVASRGNN